MLSDVQKYFPHEDYESLNNFYGNPRGRGAGKVSIPWFKNNIIKWHPTPYPFYYSEDKRPFKSGLLVHKLCLNTFDDAFSDVLKHFGEDGVDEKRLNICAGTFNYRLMRGGHTLSVHGYGIAIDIDPEHNPYRHHWTEKGIDKEFVAILEKHGFFWRGHNQDNDPMHFQCAYRNDK